MFHSPVADTTLPLPDLPIVLITAGDWLDFEEIDVDIIRFLAENGAHTTYDMFKGLENQRRPRKRGRLSLKYKYERKKLLKRDTSKALDYDHKRISRHTKDLLKIGLLKTKRLKRKNILALTFHGFHVYLQDGGKENGHLDNVMTKNSDILPLSKHWNELTQVVGENILHKSVTETVSWDTYKQIFRSQVKKDEINFQFYVFFTKPRPVVPEIKIQQILHGNFGILLSRNDELRNSYVYYLAAHDIAFLKSKSLLSEIDTQLEKLESERVLAMFERREVNEKPLFKPRTHLMQFLERYGSIEYFFTGMVIEEIIRKI